MNSIEKIQNILGHFLSSIQTVDDLENLKIFFPKLIEEEIRRRKEKHYSNFKFNYEVHRSIVKIEDLVAEDYFQYDFDIRGYMFYTESMTGFITPLETVYNILPIALPVDMDAFLRLANRNIKDNDRISSQKYIDNIRRWYQDGSVDIVAPYGEDENEYKQGFINLLRVVMLTYSEPIKLYGPTALENFQPKEIWVGVVDGKLHFATQETPRYLKLWKNVRNYVLT